MGFYDSINISAFEGFSDILAIIEGVIIRVRIVPVHGFLTACLVRDHPFESSSQEELERLGVARRSRWILW